MNNYKNILVAVDGSKEAEYALRRSIEIAKYFDDSMFTIVNVIDTSTISKDEFEKMQHEKEKSTSFLQEYKLLAENEGIRNVDVIIKYGSPQTVISEELALEVNTNLITCGATGLKGAEQYFLGSVSEAIVRTAKCDVLVIRKPTEENNM